MFTKLKANRVALVRLKSEQRAVRALEEELGDGGGLTAAGKGQRAGREGTGKAMSRCPRPDQSGQTTGQRTQGPGGAAEEGAGPDHKGDDPTGDVEATCGPGPPLTQHLGASFPNELVFLIFPQTFEGEVMKSDLYY